jgi:transcriptional regulator with XRE-family HTH domain
MRYFFREWRQNAGLTLLDLARILDISEGHVSKIETNERDFSGDYLEDFAAIVGCKNVWDPLKARPKHFVDRTGTLTAAEKSDLQRRLKRRSKEVRKLLRRDRTNGKNKPKLNAISIDYGDAT